MTTHDSMHPENQDQQDHQDKDFIYALKALPLEAPSRTLDEQITQLLSNDDVIGNMETRLKKGLQRTDFDYRQPFWQNSAFRHFLMGAAACFILAIGVSRFHQAQLAIHNSQTDILLEEQAEAYRRSKLAFQKAQENSRKRQDDTVNARFVGSLKGPMRSLNSSNASSTPQAFGNIFGLPHTKMLQEAVEDKIAWHTDNNGVQELHLKINRPYDRLIVHDASGKVIHDGPVFKKKQP